MSDNFGVQVSLKAGPHMLNVRAMDVNELVDKLKELFGTDDSLQMIRMFKLRDEETLGVAYDAIQQVFPDARVEHAGPMCPKCGGEMWDNRENKKHPKAPDFRCKDTGCLDEKGYVTSKWVDSPRRASASAGSRREQ